MYGVNYCDVLTFFFICLGMREMHMELATTLGGNIDSLNKKYPSSNDPFYDPPQDVLIGTAVAYLNPLSYMVRLVSRLL